MRNTIQSLVEKNAIIWLFSTLLTGFLAGIGAYKAIQQMADLKPVPVAVVEGWDKRISTCEQDLAGKEELLQSAATHLEFAKKVIRGKEIEIHTATPSAPIATALKKRLTDLGVKVSMKDDTWMRHYTANRFGIHIKGALDESHLLAACLKIMIPECSTYRIHAISSSFFKNDDITDIRFYLPPEND